MNEHDIHSCSYYCDRPACIKIQRDELRESAEKLDAVRQIMRRQDYTAVYDLMRDLHDALRLYSAQG